MGLRVRRETKDGRGPAGLLSIDMLWVAWLPVILIGVFHYATGSHHHWAHDVLRRLYYIPILFAAFSRGLPGGVVIALFASLSYVPHAFFLMHGSVDPGTTLNKILEIILYNVIGVVAGVLADREAERRRQAEQAFAEQKQMASQLVRAGRLAALGELVAGIAHEIKNPLHTLKGTAEIVDDIIPKNVEQSAIWVLHQEEIGRLERIAERFLSFARPTEPNFVEWRFAEVYQRIEELIIAQGHHASGVTIDIGQLSSEVSNLRIRADRDQIAQVVLNISSNALRAMQERGELRVEVGLRSHGGTQYAALTIWNNGPPIAEEDLERVFDPFFTRSQEGTGLGLAISERIAESHGGFLEVENTLETKGVAFVLVLPILFCDEGLNRVAF